MIVSFTHYMHDDWRDGLPYNVTESLREAYGEKHLPDDELIALADKIGDPFYEVRLDCELDTESGSVRLVKAEL